MPTLERVAPECRAFAAAVEALLARRRAENRPGWKDWSRDELADLAYSSYKALLRGVVRRPPRRAVVLELAAHLECGREERDRLLVAAGYAPAEIELAGEALTAALALGRRALAALPFPGVLVTRDWTLEGANPPMLDLLGFTGEVLEAILAAPPPARNVLALTFDPASPLHAFLGGGSPGWEQVVARDLRTFKRDHLFSLGEPWLLDLVEGLSNLPRFAELWARVGPDTPLPGDGSSPAENVLELQTPTGSRRFAMLTVALGDLDYPRVLAYQPL